MLEIAVCMQACWAPCMHHSVINSATDVPIYVTQSQPVMPTDCGSTFRPDKCSPVLICPCSVVSTGPSSLNARCSYIGLLFSWLLFAAGIIPALVNLLGTAYSVSERLEAAHALSSLASAGNATVASRIVDKGALPLLAAMLDCTELAARHSAVLCLAELVDHPELRVSSIGCNAIWVQLLCMHAHVARA